MAGVQVGVGFRRPCRISSCPTARGSAARSWARLAERLSWGHRQGYTCPLGPDARRLTATGRSCRPRCSPWLGLTQGPLTRRSSPGSVPSPKSQPATYQADPRSRSRRAAPRGTWQSLDRTGYWAGDVAGDRGLAGTSSSRTPCPDARRASRGPRARHSAPGSASHSTATGTIASSSRLGRAGHGAGL